MPMPGAVGSPCSAPCKAARSRGACHRGSGRGPLAGRPIRRAPPVPTGNPAPSGRPGQPPPALRLGSIAATPSSPREPRPPPPCRPAAASTSRRESAPTVRAPPTVPKGQPHLDSPPPARRRSTGSVATTAPGGTAPPAPPRAPPQDTASPANSISPSPPRPHTPADPSDSTGHETPRPTLEPTMIRRASVLAYPWRLFGRGVGCLCVKARHTKFNGVIRFKHEVDHAMLVRVCHGLGHSTDSFGPIGLMARARRSVVGPSRTASV